MSPKLLLICQCFQSLSFTLLLQHFYSFFSSLRLKAFLATQVSTSHVFNFGYSRESVHLDFAWLSLKCTKTNLDVSLFAPLFIRNSHISGSTFKQSVSLLSFFLHCKYSSIASCILSPLVTPMLPPGSFREVRRKRGSETPSKIS